MAERLVLVDYGAGNLRSVENALRAAGADNVTVSGDADDVRGADRIVLPGVGAFAACMHALAAVPGMIDALEDAVRVRARPFMGICVGMQLMAERGEEHGQHAGLGWIRGTVRKLPANRGVKVPHMGWNDVSPVRDHALVPAGEAYFLHSYAFDPVDPADLLARTDQAGPVTAAIARDTMIGVQFHPEKSQAYGLGVLSRFLEWRP